MPLPSILFETADGELSVTVQQVSMAQVSLMDATLYQWQGTEQMSRHSRAGVG